MSQKDFFEELANNLFEFSKKSDVNGIIYIIEESFKIYPKFNLELEFIEIADSISKIRLPEKKQQTILGLINSAALFGMEGFEDQVRRVKEQRQFTPSDYKPSDKLFRGIHIGNIKYIEEALSDGARINSRDDKKRTVLHYAVHWYSADFVSFLIKKGATLNVFDVNGETPLHYAALLSSQNLEYLIDSGANIESQNSLKQTAIHYAARGVEAEVIRILFDAGVDINHKDAFGNTPLHLASQNGSIKQVKNLLDVEAKLNIRNYEGKTPFLLAKENVFWELAKYLKGYKNSEERNLLFKIKESLDFMR